MLGQAEELADIGKNRWRIFSRIEFCSLNLQVVFLILIIAEIIIDSSSLPTLSATFFVKSKQFKVHCTLRQKEARTGPMWNGPQTPPRMKRLKNKAQPESEADQNSEGTITKGAAAREGDYRGEAGGASRRCWVVQPLRLRREMAKSKLTPQQMPEQQKQSSGSWGKHKTNHASGWTKAILASNTLVGNETLRWAILEIRGKMLGNIYL